MTYAINLFTNPSFENGKDGFVAVRDAVLELDYETSLYGETSLRIETPARAGSGFYTPSFQTFNQETFSASLFLKGTGVESTIYVDLVSNPGGVVKATVPVSLSENWQRVVINGVVTPPATESNLYLLIRTASARATTIWADGLQLERNASTTDYTDGDQPGCDWTGEPHASTSVREVRFAARADGSSATDGDFPVILTGAIFLIGGDGASTTDGVFPVAAVDVIGALDDFAMYRLTDPDPAMTYVHLTNAGTLAGDNGLPWARQWGLFVPPDNYPVSSGYAWKRAAYAAVGFKFAGVTPDNWQLLDDVQIELHKFDATVTNYDAGKDYLTGDEVIVNKHRFVALQSTVGNSPTTSPVPVSDANWRYLGPTYGPTDYETPRRVNTRVRPSRINLCRNPKMDNDTMFWQSYGDSTITRVADIDTTGQTEDSTLATCTALEVTVASVTTPEPGATTEIERLIPGRRYSVSMYARGVSNVANITASCGTGGANATGMGVPYGGNNDVGYGEGPFGGQEPGQEIDTTTWFRITFNFVATSSTMVLRTKSIPVSPAVYPAVYLVTKVVVEEGAVSGLYFDGDDGADYLWENGGPAGNTRSYYYPNRRTSNYIIEAMAKDSLPLGITAADPEFAVPPKQ